MITYTTNEDGSLSGNGITSIPVDHRFYTQALLQVEAGEAEILTYVEPEPTATEKVALFRKAVGDYINAQATVEGFDSIVTAVTYADEPADPVNQLKGIALREWRSFCWEYCRTELGVWQSTGVEPVIEDLIASLPVLTMP